MWRVAVADMRFRRRRFVITILAAALVFAMTLLMSGVSAALHHQDRSIVESFQGDRWFVAAGAPVRSHHDPDPRPARGRGRRPRRCDAGDPRRAVPGDDRRRRAEDVNVIATPAGVSGPRARDGRQPEELGDVVVDTALGPDAGSTVNVGGHTMEVVGTARNVSYYFGTPTIFMTLPDAQANFFGFLPLASAIVVQGVPQGQVAGLRELTVARCAPI